MNRSVKYNIKSKWDQFGHSVEEYYEDPNETVAINAAENICLAHVNKPDPVMVELGSNQCYYSMLWKKIIPSGINIMVEPFDENMERGKAHFTLNNIEGTFLANTIGVSWQGAEPNRTRFAPKPVITLMEILAKQNLSHIDFLHCDIDGNEIDMLTLNTAAFQNGLVKNVLLMTHGLDKHNKAAELITSYGLLITQNCPDPTIGWDGMIVAHV
jgi:hypothetical protein